MKILNVMKRLWHRSTFEFLNLTWIHLYPFTRNNRAEKHQAIGKEVAFLQVGKKLLLHNILNTCRRCSKGCTLGLLYTKISSKYTTSKFSIKDINHNSHKSVKHIRKINFHNRPYIKVVPCLKGGFPFISPPHLNLLIDSTKIYVRKDSGSMKFIKNIIKMWNWKAVLDVNLVHSFTINTFTMFRICLVQGLGLYVDSCFLSPSLLDKSSLTFHGSSPCSLGLILYVTLLG